MYCAACGAPNDDNAHRCVSCGELLLRPGERLPMAVQPGEAPAPHYLVGAILVTLFCCQLTGIVAIVFAAMTMGKNSAGDYAAAAIFSRRAKFWTWLSFGLGLAWMLVCVGLFAAGAIFGPPTGP